jgi:hypothetical protein
VELPTFPQAVVYQQAATAPAAPAPDLAGSAGERGGLALHAVADPEVCLFWLPPHHCMCGL